MLVKIKRGWELPEAAATPEGLYWGRRAFLKAAAAGSILAASDTLLAGCDEAPAPEAQAATGDGSPDPSAGLYPFPRNERYKLDRELSEEHLATTYNNFYEFGSSKTIWQKAQALKIRPWVVRIEGMVEQPFEIGVDELLAKMPLEERLYRHRCVEAWSMAVPWSGFPMKALVDLARPLGSAKYVRMETFLDPDVAMKASSLVASARVRPST